MSEKKECIYKIEVIVKPVTYTDDTGKERKFNAYKAIGFEGEYKGLLIDLKFRKEVKLLPENNAFIYVKAENINMNKQGRYPVIWVKKVEKISEIEIKQMTLPFATV